MDRFLKIWKATAVMAALAIVVAVSGFVSEAKTINRTEPLEKSVTYVGKEIFCSNASGIKINNKAVSKSKKKVKTSKTESSPRGFSYRTKACFTNSNAYATYGEYSDARYNAIKYQALGDYTLRFLKAGTYTISYARYGRQAFDMEYSQSKGSADYYQLYEDGKPVSNELFEEKEVNGATYYQGVSSKKIYAYSYAEYTVVEASIRTGADKKQYIYYQPANVIKTTYKEQYKVLKTNRIISSVQLGKTKLTKADSRGAYNNSSSSRRSFLSGNSGKLTVKAADKNYSITSIVVQTYDKEGEPVYTKVSNKKKINYGLNKRTSSYSSKYSSYAYNVTSLYKETKVYVCYKNKFTGEFARVDNIEKNKYGNYVISYTYRDEGDTKDSKGTTSDMSGVRKYSSFTFYKK